MAGHRQGIPKYRKESSPSCLISIDSTPYYQQRALQIETEYILVHGIGILPYWHEQKLTDHNNSLPYHPYEGNIDTYVASLLNVLYDVRFYHPSPNVDIILGGSVTAIAWINYWHKWRKIDEQQNEIFKNIINVATELFQPPDKEFLILLSPSLVYSTWPGNKRTISNPCLPYPDQIISLNDHLVRSATEQSKHPTLEVLDYRKFDNKISGREITDIHKTITLGIMAAALNHLSDL